MRKTVKIDNKDSLALRFLYNTFLGRTILLLITRVFFSKVVTKFLDSRLSKILIPLFNKKYKINKNLYEKKRYKSFNDYFIRKKKEEYINIEKDSNVLISPCDCKISVYEANNKIFKIKHSFYNLESLLKSKMLSNEYNDGYVAICRLEPGDFHRYCYIDDGYHDAHKRIKGILHTVRPIAINKKNVFITNSRSYTVLETTNFGRVIQIEVGALMVGKIKNHHTNCGFKKGEEKGYFKYGGSTIILLFKKDMVEIDKELIDNTKNGYETIVSIGEKIGIKKQKKEK